VQCTADSQCAPPVPYCGDNQRCVQCVQDNQCPATAPACNNGTCGR
jgi:hypothetical protein